MLQLLRPVAAALDVDGVAAVVAAWPRQRENGVLPRLPKPEQLHLCFSMCSHMRGVPPTSIGRVNVQTTISSAEARLAQSVERKVLNHVVVGSSPTVGVFVNGTSPCNSHRLSVRAGAAQLCKTMLAIPPFSNC